MPTAYDLLYAVQKPLLDLKSARGEARGSRRCGRSSPATGSRSSRPSPGPARRHPVLLLGRARRAARRLPARSDAGAVEGGRPARTEPDRRSGSRCSKPRGRGRRRADADAVAGPGAARRPRPRRRRRTGCCGGRCGTGRTAAAGYYLLGDAVVGARGGSTTRPRCTACRLPGRPRGPVRRGVLPGGPGDRQVPEALRLFQQKATGPPCRRRRRRGRCTTRCSTATNRSRRSPRSGRRSRSSRRRARWSRCTPRRAASGVRGGRLSRLAAAPGSPRRRARRAAAVPRRVPRRPRAVRRGRRRPRRRQAARPAGRVAPGRRPRRPHQAGPRRRRRPPARSARSSTRSRPDATARRRAARRHRRPGRRPPPPRRAGQRFPHYYPLLKLRAEFLSGDPDADADRRHPGPCSRSARTTPGRCGSGRWSSPTASGTTRRWPRRRGPARSSRTTRGTTRCSPRSTSGPTGPTRPSPRSAAGSARTSTRSRWSPNWCSSAAGEGEAGGAAVRRRRSCAASRTPARGWSPTSIGRWTSSASTRRREPDDLDELLEALEDILDDRPDLWQAWSVVVQQMGWLHRPEEALRTGPRGDRPVPAAGQAVARPWPRPAATPGNAEGRLDALRQAVAVARGGRRRPANWPRRWTTPATRRGGRRAASGPRALAARPVRPRLPRRAAVGGRAVPRGAGPRQAAVRHEPGYDWAWHAVHALGRAAGRPGRAGRAGPRTDPRPGRRPAGVAAPGRVPAPPAAQRRGARRPRPGGRARPEERRGPRPEGRAARRDGPVRRGARRRPAAGAGRRAAVHAAGPGRVGRGPARQLRRRHPADAGARRRRPDVRLGLAPARRVVQRDRPAGELPGSRVRTGPAPARTTRSP